MNTLVLFLYFILHFFFYQSDSQNCKVKIDHTPIVVKNHDSTIQRFRNMGFAIKPGYVHDNGVFNSHIKFMNLTGIEVISIGIPSDAIAKSYADFLSDGEGGTYLALTTDSLEAILSLLNKSDLDYQLLNSELFTYVIFEKTSGLEHVFLIEYKNPVRISSKYLNHVIETDGISAVWLEGNEDTARFFRVVGCEELQSVDADEVTTFRLANGKVSIINTPATTKYRVRGISLTRDVTSVDSMTISGFKIVK